jgi:hypothetical protein
MKISQCQRQHDTLTQFVTMLFGGVDIPPSPGFSLKASSIALKRVLCL